MGEGPRIPNYVVDNDSCDVQAVCFNESTRTARPGHWCMSYFRRTLIPSERSYDTTQRECLRKLWTVLLLRPFLHASRFTLRTDHKALKWIISTTNAMWVLTRWRLRLVELLLIKSGSSRSRKHDNRNGNFGPLAIASLITRTYQNSLMWIMDTTTTTWMLARWQLCLLQSTIAHFYDLSRNSTRLPVISWGSSNSLRARSDVTTIERS